MSHDTLPSLRRVTIKLRDNEIFVMPVLIESFESTVESCSVTIRIK